MKMSIMAGAMIAGFCFSVSAEEISGSRELAGESVTWSSLTGNGTLSNSSETLSVVTIDGDTDATFNGTISGNIRIVKKGDGVQTFNAENKTYTGGTHVEGGVLAVPSLSYLGKKGSRNDLSAMVVIRNGAAVRVMTDSTADSPLWMDQGVCVPEGDSGTLELKGWISTSGVLMMKNANLRLTGGGGLRLGTWLSNVDALGAKLEVSNATLQVTSGGALGGMVSDFTVSVCSGGVLEMPPDGNPLPNLVLAGGVVKCANLGGNYTGNLTTVDAVSPLCDFRLYGTLTVSASDVPSKINARRIAFGRPNESTYGIEIEQGAELALEGVLKSADETSGRFLVKTGGGVMRLDGQCAVSRLTVKAGTLAVTHKASFAAGCTYDAADGTEILLEDGVELSPTMALRDGVLSSAEVWLDAAQIPANDGEKVMSADNLGTAGGVFGAVAGTEAPIWKSAAIAGKGALAFNGSQALVFDGYTNKTDTLTTFVVMVPTSHVKWSSPFSLASVNYELNGGDDAVNGCFVYSFNGDAVSTVKGCRGIVNGDNAVGWAYEYELPSYSLDMPLILGHRRNGNSCTGVAYYGDAFDPVVKQSPQWGWVDQNIERLCIGGRMTAQGMPYAYRLMKGFIGELIVFSRSLSDAEYEHVEKYLRNKWFAENNTLPRVPMAGSPQVEVNVPAEAKAIFFPSGTSGHPGGTLVKTGSGTLIAGDCDDVAAIDVQKGEFALASVDIGGKAVIWIDPSDATTVEESNGRVDKIVNKGILGGAFVKNLGEGASLLKGNDGINDHNVLSFNKNGTLIYTGFVREDAALPRSLHVYAVVSRRSFTKFTAPFSFAHTGDSWNDKNANANFHYEEHDANGGCYRTFYGCDARGLTNGLTTQAMSGNAYFIDLPRRDTDGEAYISVNRMEADWQLSATVLEADELMSMPWYFTAGCRLSPLHVNRVSLGASMRQGGVDVGEGGYWDGRIGEFIVFDAALSVDEETALLSYLRKKWFGKGDGSLAPPPSLAGCTKAGKLHDRMALSVGSDGLLRHSLAVQNVQSLTLNGASLIRELENPSVNESGMFAVTGDISLSGDIFFGMPTYPTSDVLLFSFGGLLKDFASWKFDDVIADRFIPKSDSEAGLYWLHWRKGLAVVIR